MGGLTRFGFPESSGEPTAQTRLSVWAPARLVNNLRDGDVLHGGPAAGADSTEGLDAHAQQGLLRHVLRDHVFVRIEG